MDRRSFVSGSLGAAFYAALMGDAKAAGTSRAPKLRIREVRAIRLKGGFNPRFVRVYTEEGLTGTGEFVDTMGAEYIINNNFNVMLKGRDPLEIQSIMADFNGYRARRWGFPFTSCWVARFATACRSICMPPAPRSGAIWWTG